MSEPAVGDRVGIHSRATRTSELGRRARAEGNVAACRRGRRRSVIGFAVACMLLAGVGVAYAQGTSGDAKAIAFYTKSQAAMGQYAGIQFVGTGVSYQVTPEQGYDNFRFEFGATLRGFTPAVDHVQVVQSAGRVTEEVDTFTAAGLPPLRLWQHGRSGEVGEVMTAKPCAEFVAVNNGSYVTVGDPFVVDSGFDFAPLTKGKHGHVIVHSTWPLSGSTVHEVDTIARKTHLWVRTHSALVGGADNGEGLVAKDFHYSMSQSFESVPQVGRC